MTVWHFVWRKPHSSFSVWSCCSGGSYFQQYKELLFHFLEIRWWWEWELLVWTHHSLLFPSKKGRKSSGRLNWNITGAKMWTWKTFHFKLAAALYTQNTEEERAQEKQPWNWATFINLWLFLCGCSIASSHKLNHLKSYNSFSVSPKEKKTTTRKSRVVIHWLWGCDLQETLKSL